MSKAITQIMEGSTANVILGLFKYMEKAENVIAEQMDENPDYAEVINDSFKYMQPGILNGLHEQLYTTHCEEIIVRLMNNINPKPATKAELCAVMMDVSLKAPLSHDSWVFYATLFNNVFGFLPDGIETPQETYKGAYIEKYTKAQRQFDKSGANPRVGLQ